MSDTGGSLFGKGAGYSFFQGQRLALESKLWWRFSVQQMLVLFVAFLSLSVAFAQDFLEPEKAFPVQIQTLSGRPVVVFDVADGYFLYRDKLSVTLPEPALKNGLSLLAEVPRGKKKFDENLGKEVETLRGQVQLNLEFTGGLPEFVLVNFQGCADAGLCYPPMTQTLALRGGTAAERGFIGSVLGGAASRLGLVRSEAQSSPAVGDIEVSSSPMGPAQSLKSGAQTGPRVSADQAGDLAAQLAGSQFWLVLPVFFGLGLLLAFTPCVLPMVPILSAVVVGQGTQTRGRSVRLALAYVAGMSGVYALVGVAAGLTGQGLVAALQKPWVLVCFAVLLFGFGVAMLGAYELQLPSGLQNWLNAKSSNLQGGRYGPVVLMGGLSALLIGPCVAPPLAGALLYLSSTGDWVLGGAALLALSWGLGTPLIVAAGAAGSLLPKAGAWMESVKRFFGFLLMALAIYTLAPVLSSALLMALWALFLLVAAASMGALQALPLNASIWLRLRQGVAWSLLLMGVLQGVGAALGGDDVLRPLAPLTQRSNGDVRVKGDAEKVSALPFVRVRAEDFDLHLANLQRPAFLDFYADWCVSCKEMERFTFSDPAVLKQLGSVEWLQVDVTRNTAADQALLKRFRLFGPPGIVFFDAKGAEITGARVVGFQNVETFLATLRAAGFAQP